MTDRELLELAAKAAQLDVHEICDKYLWIKTPSEIEMGRKQLIIWDPLNDDGDALRFLAKLGLGIIYGSWAPVEIYCVAVNETEGGSELAEELIGLRGDPCAATRRAIVRAAAEIGKRMQEQKE